MKRRYVLACLITVLLFRGGSLAGQNRKAEGLSRLPEGATIAVMPMDVELFALTAGGVREPKAEWTERARTNLWDALQARGARNHLTFKRFEGAEDETIDELGHLANAVSNAIWFNHFGHLKLPSKGGRLEWSLGPEAGAIAKAMPSDYALFVFLRDSTATGGRVATMAALALVGVVANGGSQVGFATLVDLKTGQVLWFNRLMRESGDVREPEKAREVVDNLLAEFPD